MSNQPDNLIGKKLGQYEIIEQIGRGGMATVYRAKQQSINRFIAVKVLPQHFMHDPDFLERFKREVDVIAHLEHPHILPIYDYGEVDGVPFIAMRYLGGGSMAQWIRRGIPSLPSLERPFTQVSQALNHAHRQGIIHRDLKPGNIMLDENNNAYLTDFGIARVLNSNLTGSAIIGTPAYMSPEQANGLPLDARSDIYAMGVVLFELITGREPYEAPTPMALLMKHINEPMPPASLYRNDVPDEVEEVIARATAKDPNERYASAIDMAQDFRDALLNAPHDMDGATLPPGQMPAIRHTPRPSTRAPGSKTKSHNADDATMIEGSAPAPAPGGRIASPISKGEARVVPDGEPRRSPAPMIALVVILLLALVGGGLIFSQVAAPKVAIEITPTPQPYVAPTVFPGARLVQAPQYQIAVPSDWTSSEMSMGQQILTLWESPQESAFFNLAVVPVDTTNDALWTQAISDYEENALNNMPDSMFSNMLSEDTAPDGSIRRSYRIEDSGELDLPPGQMDVFFLRRQGSLMVLAAYSADETGNTFVPVFQQVLDSLRPVPATT